MKNKPGTLSPEARADIYRQMRDPKRRYGAVKRLMKQYGVARQTLYYHARRRYGS